jgi:thiol-disulfide isomerase/thioredoxin
VVRCRRAVALSTVLLLYLGGYLGGCSEAADEPASSSPTPEYFDDGTGIQWLKGDVEGAFALAAEQNKPVFLYWGAEWCPPCHAIKARVFKTREFLERSRLFIPVYLDGDTEDAQRYGERFAVMGYPTMIVFAPDGTEVTRIPNGIDIQAFADVLDLAMSSLRPLPDIARGIATGQPPDARDCKLFAYYSWEQDNDQVLAELESPLLFESAAQQCGKDHPDAPRLDLLYLEYAVRAATRDDDPIPLSVQDKQAALARLNAILTDPHAIRANTMVLIFFGDQLAAALTDAESNERARLVDALRRAFDVIAADEAASATDRLHASMGKRNLERIDDPDSPNAPVSDALEAEILARVAWADATTTTPHERQAVINAAANVLISAGLNDHAEALLLREIERSKQPYYFMSGLAELAEEDGDTAAALDWLKRAHEGSRGPATRFQWGRDYVVGLIRMTPEDAATIQAQTVSLFEELQRSDGMFYHRTARIMTRLEEQLLEWNANGDYDAQLRAIRATVNGMCSAIQNEDSSRERCEAFLAAA